MRAEIDLGEIPGKEKLLINGHDLSAAFRGVELRVRAGEVPQLFLEAQIWEGGWAKGDMDLVMASATHEALIAMGWLPPGEMPGLSEVKRLSVKSGDTLIVESGRQLNAEEASRIRQAVRQAFPNNEVLVLDKNLALAVAEADNAG